MTRELAPTRTDRALAEQQAFEAELRANSRIVGNKLSVDRAWLLAWVSKNVATALILESKKTWPEKVLAAVNLPGLLIRLRDAREYGRRIEARMRRWDATALGIEELIASGEATPEDIPLLFAQAVAKYREDLDHLERVYRARIEDPWLNHENWPD